MAPKMSPQKEVLVLIGSVFQTLLTLVSRFQIIRQTDVIGFAGCQRCEVMMKMERSIRISAPAATTTCLALSALGFGSCRRRSQ